ncbi:hypothetical protein RND81_14G140700 [Saponaria officinalis]|uniref:ATP-dependent DNA helicase n=1 Tax=Saponaria officinalis TaxID=3572 RepID=A0AAW1GTV0_SAPOF
MVLLASTCLEGPAKVWWDHKKVSLTDESHIYYDWREFKDCLYNVIGTSDRGLFGIPINITETSTCPGIKPSTDLTELLWRTKLIIWDEAPMMHRYCIEAPDRSLKDIMRLSSDGHPHLPIGGKVVVFGGDFRQILPVIPKGSRQDIVYASINSSNLWNSCKNMRLQVGSTNSNVDEISEFSKWILSIGDGLAGEPNDGEVDLELLDDIVIKQTTNPVASIVESTYPSLQEEIGNPVYFQETAVLAPTHEIVEMVNEYILSLIPSEEKIYLSSYETSKEESNTGLHELYSTEFLNTIKCSGLPNHTIKLKVGATIMLLRNIDQSSGLCNGTRLVVTHLKNRVIRATVISGSNVGDRVYIPRITLTPSDTTKLPVRFERTISYCGVFCHDY